MDTNLNDIRYLTDEQLNAAMREMERRGITTLKAGEIPETGKPTRLKGWAVSLIGFILTNSSAFFAFFANMPPVVVASLIISGAIVTSALVIMVVWLKNNREERAAK